MKLVKSFQTPFGSVWFIICFFFTVSIQSSIVCVIDTHILRIFSVVKVGKIKFCTTFHFSSNEKRHDEKCGFNLSQEKEPALNTYSQTKVTRENNHHFINQLMSKINDPFAMKVVEIFNENQSNNLRICHCHLDMGYSSFKVLCK